MFSMSTYFQGERKRKSVRGCIVDGNLAVLNLAIVKKGEAEIPGLTDNTIPRRLGPKRASKIRKLFNLTKDDDVCQYVIRRPLPAKEGKKQKFAAPKVQRLVTPVMLQRKRHRLALKRRRGEKNRLAAAEYAKVRPTSNLTCCRCSSIQPINLSANSVFDFLLPRVCGMRYMALPLHGWIVSVSFLITDGSITSQ